MIEYDTIVIGSSLSAVLCAFNNKYPIFFAEERRPFRFDYLEPALDLSCLKIPGAAKSLTMAEGKKKVGVTKELLWERLLFLLSLHPNPLHNPALNTPPTIQHPFSGTPFSISAFMVQTMPGQDGDTVHF